MWILPVTLCIAGCVTEPPPPPEPAPAGRVVSPRGIAVIAIEAQDPNGYPSINVLAELSADQWQTTTPFIMIKRDWDRIPIRRAYGAEFAVDTDVGRTMVHYDSAGMQPPPIGNGYSECWWQGRRYTASPGKLLVTWGWRQPFSDAFWPAKQKLVPGEYVLDVYAVDCETKRFDGGQSRHDSSVNFKINKMLWVVSLPIVINQYLEAGFGDLTTCEYLKPGSKPPEARLPAAKAPVEERLRQLKSLRDQGLISDVEYEKKKKELLDDL